jgi:RNA ligase (TIGR02306 family)
MSTTLITVERVKMVEHHPNADKLDIITILGWKVIALRDQFEVGDAAIYFPPDILIYPDVATDLGVAKYLKHSVYPGDIDKTQCRVASCRLRGVPSHGFVIGPLDGECVFGEDRSERFGGIKYVPPMRVGAGDAASDMPNFHRYTDIESVGRYPDAIPEGTEVRITEKLHGTHCRLGLIRDEDGDFKFVAGSMNARRKTGQGLYWNHMTEPIMALLSELCDEKHDVMVYGEIFGPGIQDLDYGRPFQEFLVFDVAVNGVYLDWADIAFYGMEFDIKPVPVLYTGPYSDAKVEELTYGDTTLADPEAIRSKFKGREGVVVTPLQERFSSVLCGRMIVKSVSADYRDRKGAKDIE